MPFLGGPYKGGRGRGFVHGIVISDYGHAWVEVEMSSWGHGL